MLKENNDKDLYENPKQNLISKDDKFENPKENGENEGESPER